MAIFVEVVVKIIGYFSYLLGVLILAHMLLADRFRLYNRNRRLRSRQQTESHSVNSEIFNHLKNILYSISKNPNESKVWNFIIFSIGLFISTFLTIAILTGAYVIAIGMGILFMVIPYIVIRFRLSAQRAEASLAFMQEFHLFLQAYQKHKDVYHSLYEASQSVRDKKLKKSFNRFLSSIQKERSEEAFIEAVHLFSYSVGSSFTSRFASLLIKSYREQTDVSEAMMDLHRDIRKREKDIAQIKTRQLETIFIGYLPLFILPLFVFMAYRVTMMYSIDFIFEQSESLVGLFFSVFLAVLSALGAYLMGKPRADL